jgi:hypothetical protein
VFTYLIALNLGSLSLINDATNLNTSYSIYKQACNYITTQNLILAELEEAPQIDLYGWPTRLHLPWKIQPVLICGREQNNMLESSLAQARTKRKEGAYPPESKCGCLTRQLN